MPILRLIVIVLLLANGLFFVWSQGYLGPTESGHEPERLAAQRDPDKLRIVPEGEITSVKPAAAAAPGEKAEEPSCRTVSGLTGDNGAKFVALTHDKLPGLTVTQSSNDLPGHYDVVVAGLAVGAPAEARQVELKGQGVAILKAETDDNGKIRLVLRSSEGRPMAVEFLNALVKRGIKGLSIRESQAPRKEQQVELRGSEANFAGLNPLLEGFAGSRVADCPSPTPKP